MSRTELGEEKEDWRQKLRHHPHRVLEVLALFRRGPSSPEWLSKRFRDWVEGGRRGGESSAAGLECLLADGAAAAAYPPLEVSHGGRGPALGSILVETVVPVLSVPVARCRTRDCPAKRR